MGETERVASPMPLNEESVRAASQGKGEAVLGERRPVLLSEEEVKAAGLGRSEEIMRKAHAKHEQKK